MILLAIHILLLVVIGGFLFWLLILSLLSLTRRSIRHPAPDRSRSFAVLVPAHNEGTSITGTIRSLLDVDYPSDAFDVVVIADNCTDDTASVAEREGARVLTRDVPGLRGKGHALGWCFEQLKGRGYEAFAVVDADSTVSRNLLSQFNTCLQEGAEAIQCNDQVKPQRGSWSSEAIRMGFALYNFVRPSGRSVFGFSSGLRGNGMCFSAGLLQRVPWSAISRAEDLEYSLQLALRGVRVVFAPDATVLATMTRDPKLAESQRARWEGGRLPLIRQFALPLLAAALRRRSLMVLDVLVDLVTPALVNLMVVALIGFMVAIAQWWFGDRSMRIVALLWGVVVAFGVLHAAVGLRAAKSDTTLMSLAGIVPRYALWKIRLYGKLILRGDTGEWKRTAREPEQSI